MKITCHSCAAKYTVSDEKVQGKTVKMKCRKCGATIVVGGAPHPGEAASDEAPMSVAGVADPGDSGGQDVPAGSFLVNVNDGDQRTMTLAEIVAAHQSGVVNSDTYVWADGMADWQPLSDNAAIASALSGGNGSGRISAPGPSPMPLAAAPAARESSRPAARRDSGNGRRGADLFSGGMSDGGLGTASVGQSGKRDENSVLFSLSSLTSAAPTPAKSSTTATKEDSGLIDLKALAAAAPSAPSAAPAVVDSIGLFPLGSPVLAPPPAAAPAPIVIPDAPKKSNMGIIMVMGGLLIAAIAVAVFFAVRGTTQVPTATAAPAAQTAAPPPAETQTAAPQTTATAVAADPTSTASVAASGTAKAPTGTYHPPAGVAHPPTTSGGGTQTTSGGGTTTPPPPPPHPAGGGCACPPGDLMCAMQKCAGKK